MRLRPTAYIALSVITLGIAWAGWSWLTDDSIDMHNRVWVEKMPRDSRDMVRTFVPLKAGGKQFGAVTVSSRYRYAGDRFTWNVDRKGNLAMEFPQDRQKVTVKARAWKCGNEAPAPFDLCLELKRGKEKTTLYSRKLWIWPRPSDAEGADAIPVMVPSEPLEAGCDACVEEVPRYLRDLGLTE